MIAGEPEAKSEERFRPYEPSWVDRLISRVRALPGPRWLAYVMAWLVLFLLETAVKWGDGSYPVGALFLFHIAYTGVPIGCLALIHYLDGKAETTLAAFRPALAASEAEYDKLCYELTVLPARETLLAGLVGALLAGPILWLVQAILPSLKLFSSPQAAVLDGLIFLFTWWAIATLAYHTIRQLSLVNRIYTRHTRIDLFQLAPLHAFSGLTARTGIGWMTLLYAWHAPVPIVLSQPASLSVILAMMLLGVVAFAWPLLGVHRLLEGEKGRLEAEAGRRMKAALEELHRQIDEGQPNEEATAALNNTINSLVVEHNVLAKIPTWPWRTETLSGMGTVVLFPLLLWLVEQVLLRVILP